MLISEKIRLKAKQLNKRILLPEVSDIRILKAASYLQEQDIVQPVFLGNADDITKRSQASNVNIDGIECIDPNTLDITHLKTVLNDIFQRKHKTVDVDSLLSHDLYISALLLKEKVVDGVVAGASYSTQEVLRAAFNILGTKPGIKTISGAFIISLNNKDFIFADCAVVIDPNEEQLADIAISSAQTLEELLGTTAKVAMLSFSSKGSAKHKLSERIIRATNLVKAKNSHLIIDGELQLDAAIVPEIAAKKASDSILQGDANVLVFPNLDAGNIGYKLVEKFAQAKAIGPVLQGIAHPMNDLSRGASVDDIIDTIALTALQ